MYPTHGRASGKIGDVEVILDDGVFHCFHLVLSEHNRVAHLVSDDGLVWRERKPALELGPPGAFDDFMIWTVSVTRSIEGDWVMLYTALSTVDEGRIQRVGVAVSDDLDHWTRRPDSRLEADPRWYISGRDADHPWVAWRDPKPVRVGDEYLATICGRSNRGRLIRQGVVALAASRDLRNWEVRAPLFAPTRWFELECPQLFTLGGRWYVTAAVMEDRSQRYWMADEPLGPWVAPPDNRLLPQGHYAARICPTDGDDKAVFCWHRASTWRTEPPSSVPAIIPSPLLLQCDERGRLYTTPWPAWTDRFTEPQRVEVESLTPWFDQPSASREGNELTSPYGMELWTGVCRGDGLLLRAELYLRGPVAGVALDVDEHGGGLFFELHAGQRVARLVELRRREDLEYAPWFHRNELQLRSLGPMMARVSLSLRLVDRELEVCLDDRVVIACHVPPTHDTGRFGLFVEHGRMVVEGLQVEDLTPIAL